MHLDRVKARLAELAIARPDQVVPCTEAEVRALEQRLGVSVPAAYREFLLWMGHGAGDLLRGSACFYEDLSGLRAAAVQLLNENGFAEPLPRDAFVFFTHQGYQFNFLRPSEGDDPPVHFYGEGTGQTSFRVIHPKYSEFLTTEIEDHARLRAASQALRSKPR